MRKGQAMTLLKRAAAEAVGTAFLLTAIVGSGIMAERLASGNVAIALLANTIATSAALIVLILALGPISGAHFNPVVSLISAWLGGLAWRELLVYVASQFGGAFGGVAIAHLMFEFPLFELSQHTRSGTGLVFSEFIATFGLLLVILSCRKHRATITPFAVGLYITAAYWFTGSTSFANPAVTLARSFTNTFAGIRLADVSSFVVAQVLGALVATAFCAWLIPGLSSIAKETVVLHEARNDR
jgi:glycerol uptake facilitator-like aquaporin